MVIARSADAKINWAGGGYQENRHEAREVHRGGKLYRAERDQAASGAQARAHP